MIAIVIVAILRFFFNASVLLQSKTHSTIIETISNAIVFASVGYYLTKIKFCPDVKNHLLLMVMEAVVGIIIIELLMSLWGSCVCVITNMLVSAFSNVLQYDQIVFLSDIIIMGLTTCILLTAMIEGKVLENLTAYYRKRMSCNKSCEGPKFTSTPKKQKNQETLYRDPSCPIHGNASSFY